MLIVQITQTSTLKSQVRIHKVVIRRIFHREQFQPQVSFTIKEIHLNNCKEK